MERYKYNGFSVEDREFARKRADDKCEFPAGCKKEPTGTVSHVTGSFEGWLDHKDPNAIGDINLNSVLLCGLHEAHHDAWENFQVQCLKAERFPHKGIIYARHQRRRNRGHV